MLETPDEAGTFLAVRVSRLRGSAVMLLVLSAVAVLVGCENTPIDAVVADDLVADGGGPPGDAATCTSTRADPGPGQYRLYSAASARCLGAGVPTTVVLQPAFTTEMTTDCGSDAQLWQLSPSMFGTSLRLRNVARDLYLDIERGSDTPGTPAILYDMNTLPNQLFAFRERTTAEFEIAPGNAVGSCLTEVLDTVEIWPCSMGDARQSWTTFLATCP